MKKPKFKVGDKVRIIAGACKGLRGFVVLLKRRWVVVEVGNYGFTFSHKELRKVK